MSRLKFLLSYYSKPIKQRGIKFGFNVVDSKLKSAPFILICHFRNSYYIIVLISFFIFSNRAKLLAIKKHWVLLDKLNSIMNICYLLGLKKEMRVR